jgi:serine/threonine-protein kinase
VSPVPSQSIRTQLEKILASRPFAKSERMSRFLRYTVELALAGRADDIKEYRVGVDVFDRKAGYDPRVDPIVRVEARRLRRKLCDYYAGEGQSDEVLIDFEKGTYVPCFRARTAITESPAPVTAPHNRTVAVLPFADLGPDVGHEYFTDGLTEELIHALTRVEGLHVVAWQSAAQFRGNQRDIRAIGEQLRVSTVLMGSVSIAGSQLRVRAQLVETATGFYLWSEAYDREMSDIFSIQEEIARAIVRTLQVQLSARYDATPIARSASNLDAYDLYLKGRYHWNMRTPEGLTRSVHFFMGAIALDSRSALAHAGLADAYSLLTDYALMSSSEAMPKARAAARRALELAPDLAEAWTSLAYIRSMYDWEWVEAGHCYRRAVELNPGYATAHFWLGIDYYALLGRHDLASASLEKALELDPLSLTLQAGKATLYVLCRDYEAAIQSSRDLVESAPSYYRGWTGLGRAYIQLARYDLAIEALERGHSLAGDVPNILAALGQAHALAGRPDEARKLLARLEQIAAGQFAPCTSFALIHSALGETGRALACVEASCDRREMSLAAAAVHPVYDPLRSEPRFQQVLRRMHLLE